VDPGESGHTQLIACGSFSFGFLGMQDTTDDSLHELDITLASVTAFSIDRFR
jgi:hypothetical protein